MEEINAISFCIYPWQHISLLLSCPEIGGEDHSIFLYTISASTAPLKGTTVFH
jgi:hypothetical protein